MFECVKLHTRDVFVALPQVREPAATEDPVSVRRPLCEQPHCCGDQPQGVSLSQVYHASGEHEAIVDAAALQCPLQVTQTQRAIPACSRTGQTSL